MLPALNQTVAPPATDAVRVAALKRLSNQLALAADDHPGPGDAEAEHLSATLRSSRCRRRHARPRRDARSSEPLRIALAQLRALLQPTEITRATLPQSMADGWVSPDGRALVDVVAESAAGRRPERRRACSRRFADAVQKAEPDAIGGPISILHSAKTIIKAFQQAAALSLLAIAILLWIALRRLGDVLRTLIPLLVSAIVTLELCVVFDMPLNFANIIALPLMLGVGVAFKIYFVMAWRSGQTRSFAVEPHARRDVQRGDHGHRVWQLVVFASSGYLEHGTAARAVAVVHADRRGGVPAGADGQAAQGEKGRARADAGGATTRQPKRN